MLYETVKLARLAIQRNPLRSFLTVLGIVIGVGAVIAMVLIGNGTTAKITADMAKLGVNLLFVRPGQFGPGRPSASARQFNARDLDAIRTQIRHLRAAAPVSQLSVTAVYGSENHQSLVQGTDNALLTAQDWTLSAGRPFFESEVRGGRAACVLGETVRRELFGAADPLGHSIRVQHVSCEVIGVLKAKGQSGFGTDQDDVIMMPIRAYQRRIAGTTNIATLLISVEEGYDTQSVQRDIQLLLRERRNISSGKEDDFTVGDMRQLTETMTGTTAVLTGLLGAVAAVSLLVGGIGIMNIMLVSVTERTREIGIRLAIGALEGQVLMQFLIEAVVLSLFGGILGISLGLGLAWLATSLLQVPFVLAPTIVFVAFGFSALIGVVFGYFPARRAARLDPIQALRHE